MKPGFSNVISLLHRGPGIARATHPEIYEVCAVQAERVKAHLAVEGMKLLHEPALGLFSAVCRDRDEIADECLEQGIEPFLPIWNAQALDYHTSIVAVLLRLARVGFEGSAEGWTDLDDLIANFETYLPDEEKGDEVRIRDKVAFCLKQLVSLGFAEHGQTADGKDAVRGTGWLILRLTTAEIERFENLLQTESTFAEMDQDITTENEETADA